MHFFGLTIKSKCNKSVLSQPEQLFLLFSYFLGDGGTSLLEEQTLVADLLFTSIWDAKITIVVAYDR